MHFQHMPFCEQNRYLHSHLVKSRTIKLCSFVNRLKEENACLEEFPHDTEGQETASLPADEIMGIIFHSMPATWKNKMIEQSAIYADSTVKEITNYFQT